jgi:twinkle protein
MTDRAEKGRGQLESAIVNFPNLVPDSIDLSAFMDDEHVHRIKKASAYRDKLIELIENGGERGHPMPWESFGNNFEFRESELTVWAGYKGHGKSLVISQVFEKFLNDGKKAFIISPEFPPHRVLHRMLVQSFGLHQQSRKLAIDFVDAINDQLWIYDQQSSLKPNDVPALCRYAVDRLGVQHVLIDSLMKCGIAPDDYAKQKHLVDAVQQVAHRSKAHIHLVAHMRKDKSDGSIGGLHDVKGASEIADMVENVIIVWRNKEKEQGGGKMDEPDCVIKVDAQRNADGWIGKIPLWYNKETMTFRDGK